MNNVLQANDVVILLSQIVSSLNKQQVLQAHYCQKRVTDQLFKCENIIYGGCPRTFNQFINNKPIQQVISVILVNIEQTQHLARSGIP